MSSPNHDDLAHLKFPLQTILEATNNFHKQKIVYTSEFEKGYLGELVCSGALIQIQARRWLNEKWDDEKEQQFWMEISLLSTLNHKNLVSLVGFCDEDDEKVIIYKHETRGSLHNHLSTSILLTWVQKLEISVGIAHALSYIHYDDSRDFSVIHRNIDSEFIFLNDKWEPKLGDFTRSMKIKASERHQSFKPDIYSFGIVMSELLFGSIIDMTPYREKTLDEIIDWDLPEKVDMQSFNIFTEIASDCLNDERSQRPNVDEIVTRLEKAVELQLEHQKAL